MNTEQTDLYDILSHDATNLILFAENDYPTYQREREILSDLIERRPRLDARQWDNAVLQAAKNYIAFAIARYHADINRRTIFTRATRIEAGNWWTATLDDAIAEYQPETEAAR